MGEDWVPPLPDSEVVRLAWHHGTPRPAFDRGPDRCDGCGLPYPCVTLRLAVDLLERRGLDPSDPDGPYRRAEPEHGTRRMYDTGCRCSACVAVSADNRAEDDG